MWTEQDRKKPDTWTLKFGARISQVQIDHAKRRTKCHLCDVPILKGERRVRTKRHYQTPHTTKWGGQVFACTRYFHAQCVVALILEPGEAEKAREERRDYKWRHCANCDLALPSGPHGWWDAGGNDHRRICLACTESEHFRQCHWCVNYFMKSKLSPVRSDDLTENGNLACDRCAINYDLSTTRRLTLAKEAEIRFEKKWDNLLDTVRDQGVWGDGAPR